jgi:hypothetical protein
MNKRTGFFKLLILITALVSVSCRTAEFGFKVIDIHGMVYDFSNRPVAHCEISLGRKLNTTTDINGRFTLPKVPIGAYTLTGFKRGFEVYKDEVTIRDRGQIIYFRIPSQNQLLDLVDEALVANNFPLAADLAERAYQIDKNNVEMLFYFAAVNFRQGEYLAAINLLEAAKNLGSKDSYADKFLLILRELQNAKSTN